MTTLKSEISKLEDEAKALNQKIATENKDLESIHKELQEARMAGHNERMNILQDTRNEHLKNLDTMEVRR